MNRRVRTGPLTRNAFGRYVYYRSVWEGPQLINAGLIISGGPLAGAWLFPQ